MGVVKMVEVAEARVVAEGTPIYHETLSTYFPSSILLYLSRNKHSTKLFWLLTFECAISGVSITNLVAATSVRYYKIFLVFV
jgi:hypothetical protein